MPLQCGMGGKSEIFDRDRDISTLAFCKDRFLGKEGKAICADIIQSGMILQAGFLNGYNTIVGNVNSWVFTAVQDLGS